MMAPLAHQRFVPIFGEDFALVARLPQHALSLHNLIADCTRLKRCNELMNCTHCSTIALIIAAHFASLSASEKSASRASPAATKDLRITVSPMMRFAADATIAGDLSVSKSPPLPN